MLKGGCEENVMCLSVFDKYCPLLLLERKDLFAFYIVAKAGTWSKV